MSIKKELPKEIKEKYPIESTFFEDFERLDLPFQILSIQSITNYHFNNRKDEFLSATYIDSPVYDGTWEVLNFQTKELRQRITENRLIEIIENFFKE